MHSQPSLRVRPSLSPVEAAAVLRFLRAGGQVKHCTPGAALCPIKVGHSASWSPARTH